MSFKKTAILFVVGLVLLSCKEDPTAKINKENAEAAQQRDYSIKNESPIINFDRSEHDFGTINEGDVVETTFDFKNTGKNELIIYSAKASCGCTVPEYPKQPILPGESGIIKVKFNSAGKPNKQMKEITLTTNTLNGVEKVFIKAQVTPKAS
ncbi:DUF1573 domain-containing protein [Namhaeicola litoreus]|uniref:DUF1573 domain-containing protein n=1 Tax=Namhaeicola litoreus TaxID=1052145 RepID=A0ABW3Y6E2_9FLAO